MADSPLQSIGGLASGLDTNSIVASLMAIESQGKVRLAQRQRVEEARQQALKDVQTRLTNLSTQIQGLRDVGTWAQTQSIASSDPTRLTVAKSGGPPAGSWVIDIAKLARAGQMASNGTTTAATKTDTLRVTVGTSFVDVPVTLGDSLETIAAKINNTANTPVQASVVNSKLLVSGRTTGAANTISITSTNTLAADLGFTQTVAPDDASYRIDGGAWTTRSTNKLTEAIPGLELTFVSPTTSSVNVTVGDLAPDKAAVKSKVQALVDQYNSTLDFIQGKLSEKRVPNATTDTDRAKGVLNGDSALSGLLSQLRAAFGDTFAGLPAAMSNLSQAGVSTGASTGTGAINKDAISGRLTLDSAKLDTALTSNFSDVKSLFTNITGSYSSEGLAQRLDRVVGRMLGSDGMLTSRLTSEAAMITQLKSDQSAMDERLSLKEKQYRATFTAMEKALSMSQSQGQWLSGQLAKL